MAPSTLLGTPAHAQEAGANAPGALAEAEALAEEIERYNEQGRYQDAIPLAERALALRLRARGPTHPEVAEALNELAVLHLSCGAYAKAEELLRRALDIQDSTPDRLAQVPLLGNLAQVYDERGEHERAESLYQQALAIGEAALGKDHIDLAPLLGNLAALYRAQGAYERALPLAERVLTIVERDLGPRHPHVAIALDNLAALHEARGQHAQAAARMERSVAILEQSLDPAHPHLATALNNLASLYRKQGAHERARPLYERALGILERSLGDRHPYVATTLYNMASLYWGAGRGEQALRFFRRGMEVREHNLAALLATGSEAQKHERIATLHDETDTIVSFHLHGAFGDARAADLALETILRRKGRVLDATAGAIHTLRRQLDAPERALLDELGHQRAALARHMLAGPDGDVAAYRAQGAALHARIEALEAELSLRSSQYRAQARATTVAAVQAHLADDTALIELFRYRPRQPRARTPDEGAAPPRYAAYVLRARGPVVAVDLGEAAGIDALVASWRRSLERRQPAALTQARALHARVMAPVRPLLGDAQHLFVAPDGDLALIPFAALVDGRDGDDAGDGGGRGRYLIERYRITYLTSGRDLLRHDGTPPPRQEAVVMADPHFDAAPASSAAAPTAPTHSIAAGAAGDASAWTSAADLLGIHVAPLPGTAHEAEALRARLAHVEVWTGADATETRLARLRGPRLLHLATHGIWLGDTPVAVSLTAPGPGPAAPRPVPSSIRNGMHGAPMLRSGLALAGFNRHASGADDGFLSALELASLDLHGTQLVVLSACDTGLGQAESGQGVYGLRRALVLAGAQTQVMSLWKVDDIITRDLMLAYYDRLLAGEGRSEAMRQAQLALLRRSRTAHPYAWAGFIVSGDPKPMTDLVPRATPPAAGCGMSSRSLAGGGFALVVLAMLLIQSGRLPLGRRRGARP